MGLKKTKRILALSLAATTLLGLAACGNNKEDAAAVDYNAMSLDDLIAAAKKEGQVHSVGMPDT